MKLDDFLREASNSLSLEALTAVASDRAAFGDDVLAAFRSQLQLRVAEGERILRDGKGDSGLLAGEARRFDGVMRERDMILGLMGAVEKRTAERGYVPASQTAATETRTTPEAPIDVPAAVLTREQALSKWLQQRGGYAYAGEKGPVRFGAIVRALALGDRKGLSALEQRALAEGSDSAGGYTVPEVVATAFIDRVRNAMVVMRAGAQTVPMTSDTLNIARVGQPDSVSPDIQTAQWKTENAPIDESDVVLERVQFTARTLPVLLKLSVELSEDSVNIDQVIERELSQQLALELDRVALLGSGVAPEPRGIRNQSGVSVTALNAEPSNHDFIIDAIGRVWGENHEPNARIYNASLATAIAKFKESTTDAPLATPEVVAAVPAFRTNQIPNAGSSPDDTTLFVGDFRELLIGMRTSFRLEVSRVAGEAFERLQIWVRAYLRADVQLAHPEAFDVTTDVRF